MNAMARQALVYVLHPAVGTTGWQSTGLIPSGATGIL